MGKLEAGEGCCDRLSSAHGGGSWTSEFTEVVVTSVDQGQLRGGANGS